MYEIDCKVQASGSIQTKKGGDLSGLGFLVGGGLGTSIEVGKCGKCGDHSPHDKD